MGSNLTEVGVYGRVTYAVEVKNSVMCCCPERWWVSRCATLKESELRPL
jgi:hypothetical protein